MKVQVNDAANSQKELVFEIPYEVFESAADKELDKLLPTAKIPGFRPGKAPKEVARKQFSHRIKSQAIEKVINDAVHDGMTSNGITPISQAHISDMVFEENKPIEFKARVDVFPVVTLNKYSDFSFDKTEVSVSDEDVEKALTSLQEKEMTYEPVSNGRDAVISGDIAVIDFDGKLDGISFDGGSAKNFSLNIGSGQFIPGFEDGVIGMKTGEEKDIPLKFPDNYGNAELSGKDVVFTVKLHEIKEKVKPEINDDFAKDIDPSCDNLNALKEKLKKILQAEVSKSAKMEAFEDILSKIVEENPFEVPYSLIKDQSERLAYGSMSQFYQMGLDPEQAGISFEMMVQRYTKQAEDQVKQAVMINEIAKKENITVEDADIDKYLEFHAVLQNKTVNDLKKELEANHQLETVKNDVLGDKVFAFLETVNKVNVKKMTREEYDASKTAPKEAVKNDGVKEDKKEKAKKKPAKSKDSEDKEDKPKAKKTAAKSGASKKKTEKE